MSLSELQLVLAVEDPQALAAKEIGVKWRNGKKIAWVQIGVESLSAESTSEAALTYAAMLDPNARSGYLLNLALPGVLENPGILDVYVEGSTGKRAEIVGSLPVIWAKPEPLTAERIAALSSRPKAIRSVIMQVQCKVCSGEIKTFASLQAEPKLESDGYVRHSELADRFVCSCAETKVDLQYLRSGLHALLGLSADEQQLHGVVPVALYDRKSLGSIAIRLREMLAEKVREEILQQFFEKYSIMFSRWTPRTIRAKAPVLAKYKTDFAIHTGDGDLVLIEIERSTTKLVNKKGDMAEGLTHAVGQVQKWLHEFDDHRVAALDAIGLKPNEVRRILGVVIAGRRPEGDRRQLDILQKYSSRGVEIFTYDDVVDQLESISKSIP